MAFLNWLTDAELTTRHDHLFGVYAPTRHSVQRPWLDFFQIAMHAIFFSDKGRSRDECPCQMLHDTKSSLHQSTVVWWRKHVQMLSSFLQWLSDDRFRKEACESVGCRLAVTMVTSAARIPPKLKQQRIIVRRVFI